MIVVLVGAVLAGLAVLLYQNVTFIQTWVDGLVDYFIGLFDTWSAVIVERFWSFFPPEFGQMFADAGDLVLSFAVELAPLQAVFPLFETVLIVCNTTIIIMSIRMFRFFAGYVPTISG